MSYINNAERIEEQFNNLYYGLTYWQASIAIMRFHALRIEAEVRFAPIRNIEQAQYVLSLANIVESLADDVPVDVIENCASINRQVAAARKAAAKGRSEIDLFLLEKKNETNV
jgi:hypothetical protein